MLSHENLTFPQLKKPNYFNRVNKRDYIKNAADVYKLNITQVEEVKTRSAGLFLATIHPGVIFLHLRMRSPHTCIKTNLVFGIGELNQLRKNRQSYWELLLNSSTRKPRESIEWTNCCVFCLFVNRHGSRLYRKDSRSSLCSKRPQHLQRLPSYETFVERWDVIYTSYELFSKCSNWYWTFYEESCSDVDVGGKIKGCQFYFRLSNWQF